MRREGKEERKRKKKSKKKRMIEVKITKE